MCIAVMLTHCTNDANHCKINDACIALTLICCKNNANHRKINDICTEAPGGAGLFRPKGSGRQLGGQAPRKLRGSKMSVRGSKLRPGGPGGGFENR